MESNDIKLNETTHTTTLQARIDIRSAALPLLIQRNVPIQCDHKRAHFWRIIQQYSTKNSSGSSESDGQITNPS